MTDLRVHGSDLLKVEQTNWGIIAVLSRQKKIATLFQWATAPLLKWTFVKPLLRDAMHTFIRRYFSETTATKNHSWELGIPSVLRFSLSSAQLVDLAENTAAGVGPFSPSLAKNSFRARVFPFFFLPFLAARRNTPCYKTTVI